MPNTKEILEELKQFRIIIPDGKFKNCLVYQESVKQFVISKLKEQLEEVKDGIKKEYNDLESYESSDAEEYCRQEGYNQAIDNVEYIINNKIKELN